MWTNSTINSVDHNAEDGGEQAEEDADQEFRWDPASKSLVSVSKTERQQSAGSANGLPNVGANGTGPPHREGEGKKLRDRADLTQTVSV